MLALFMLSCAAAALFPATRNINATPAVAPENIDWPEPRTWQGLVLSPTDGFEAGEEFLFEFPGIMRQYIAPETGTQFLLRFTNLATSRMHPSETCYRALGWELTPLSAERDVQGHLWSRFRYDRPDGTSGIIKQCFFSLPEQLDSDDLADWTMGIPSWPDASSWYWAACMPASEIRSTLAITIDEPLPL